MLRRMLHVLMLLVVLAAVGCASSDGIDAGPRSPEPFRGTGANPLDLHTP